MIKPRPIARKFHAAESLPDVVIFSSQSMEQSSSKRQRIEESNEEFNIESSDDIQDNLSLFSNDLDADELGRQLQE